MSDNTDILSGGTSIGILATSSTLVISLMVVTILGNGILLFAIYRKKNSLQLTTLRDLDIVITSLAITDLLIGLVGIPFRLIALAMDGQGLSDRQNEHFKGNYGRIINILKSSIKKS